MTSVKVFLTDKIAQRIENAVRSEDGPSLGYLIGYKDVSEDAVHAVGAVRCDDAKRLALAQHQVSLLLPPGLSIIGIFLKTKQSLYRAIVEQLCQMVFPAGLEAMFPDPSIVVFAAELEEDNESAVYLYDLKERTASLSTLEKPPTPPLSNSLIFRLKSSVDLKFQLNNNPDKQRENIVVETYAIRARLLSPDTMFRVNGTNILLNGDGKPVKGGQLPYKADAKCRDFLTIAGIWDKYGKKKNSASLSEVIVSVSILEDLTGHPPISCTPVINHKHEKFTLASVPLTLDAICYVHENEPVTVWSGRLREALDRQLEAITNCLLATGSKGSTLYSPVPYHFHPTPLQHVFTVVHPDGAPETKLADRRRSLQRDFLLPATRPYTKPANKCSFPDDCLSGATYLTNVHDGLRSSGVAGGEVHTVDGTYSYHHYMQDRINDDGWGCAYRSLQTLVSWFRFQGYTEKAIPTHTEIQQILVDIGDKPPKFVNSRQWIGSVEVSYVLNTLLEVDSKTLYVSSGAELGNKGRELAQHFDTQGTPVMIGGGVLAHTILGVSFNDSTGELKFLILDPHYKGGEDLKLIQDKGWCGWKGVDFWDQNAYYNLCMPQRPAMV